MHEKAPLLKASFRDKLGSRFSKRFREQGLLPGVVYGHGQQPIALNFQAEDAIEHIEAGEKVFRLDLPGDKHKDEGQVLLLKELQFDYLGTNIIHADFARVDLDERVKTKVHIELFGEAIGLKSAGAILIHPVSEIEVECRVRDLPESIVVEITTLELNQSITADKVPLPSKDMKLVSDPHQIIAQIVEAKEEVIVAEAAAVEGAAAAGPEVIGEKERAEKAAAAEAEKKGGAKGGGAAKAAAPAKK